MIKSVFIINFVIALFLCAHFSSCRSDDDKHQTILNVQLQHKPQRIQRIYIYAYPDSFSVLHTGKVLMDSCDLDDQGIFKLSFSKWHKAGFIDLAISTEPLISNLFLIPGQQLSLEFDCAQTPAVLSNRNQLDDYNRFLQEFSDTFYRSPGVKDFYYAKSNYLLAPEYANYIDARHQQELDFSHDVLKDTSLDQTFRAFVRHEIDYQWANDKIAFLWKKWIRNEEVPIDSGYYNFLKDIKIDNPDALQSPAYWRFLQLYIREMHRQLPVERQLKEDAAYTKCTIAQQLTSGMALKIALLHILNNELDNASSLGVIDEGKRRNVQDLARHMVSITGDPQYNELVKRQLNIN